MKYCFARECRFQLACRLNIQQLMATAYLAQQLHHGLSQLELA
jgi:hypothetical protein